MQGRAEGRLIKPVIGDHMPAKFLHHRAKARQAGRGDEADHHGMLLRNHALQFAHEVGDRPFVHGGESTQQAGFTRKLRPEAQGAIKIRKGHDAGAPVPGGSQRHFDFRDDGVGAIGVMHQFDLVAADVEQARRLFRAHDFNGADISTVAQHAPHGRTDAAAAARHKAADG